MLTEIKAEKISKAYSNSKKYALRDFDFYAKKGSVTAVIGQNGAGKSTLFKILSGTIFCDEGSLSVCGKTELNEIRRVCSYVPETLDYTKNFTVSEELYFYAASFVDKNNVAESVNKACDFLSLNYTPYRRIRQERRWGTAALSEISRKSPFCKNRPHREPMRAEFIKPQYGDYLWVSLYFLMPRASRSIALSRSCCLRTYAMWISLSPLPGVA